jgi:cell division septum initiation protein DivIVA
MTKAQEIAKLEEFMQSIPRDSYLRPWLEDVLPQVRADILNDFCVSPSVTETRQRAEVILNEARQQAADIVARAEKNAADVMTLARQKYQQIIGRARSAIHEAERALDHV